MTQHGSVKVEVPDGATPLYDVNGSSGLNDIIESLQEQVYTMAREAGNAPSGLLDDIQAFTAAVDWSERWIQALLGFHVALWMITLWTRRYIWWQCGTFFAVCGLVWSAEPMNTWAAAHWQDFSKQDYFQPNGFFVGVMYAAPLLALAMFQMINFLCIAANLLVEVSGARPPVP
eukprot:CAMPEP_0118969460 /NCGR_PEP_ID=MMETSP1173-20130426/6556_1 /TAXON_ID=1034831 /ORGANISM="Rhizochromulina marina cf, Strain CCMP1243" /LENGTH=173 /DNA_ID=CAMNT_0006918705 /DNA_START=114 /DNA_END=635 /DNA_ORIENTATION=-